MRNSGYLEIGIVPNTRLLQGWFDFLEFCYVGPYDCYLSPRKNVRKKTEGRGRNMQLPLGRRNRTYSLD